MKNQFRPKDSEFENQTHIARKKKATAKVFNKKSKEDKTFEYGLDDDREIDEYEKYLK